MSVIMDEYNPPICACLLLTACGRSEAARGEALTQRFPGSAGQGWLKERPHPSVETWGQPVGRVFTLLQHSCSNVLRVGNLRSF